MHCRGTKHSVQPLRGSARCSCLQRSAQISVGNDRARGWRAGGSLSLKPSNSVGFAKYHVTLPSATVPSFVFGCYCSSGGQRITSAHQHTSSGLQSQVSTVDFVIDLSGTLSLAELFRQRLLSSCQNNRTSTLLIRQDHVWSTPSNSPKARTAMMTTPFPSKLQQMLLRLIHRQRPTQTLPFSVCTGILHSTRERNVPRG